MNSFGRVFRVGIFGESHGDCVGVTLDGVPAGIGMDSGFFAADLDRRRPAAAGTTARKEADEPVILSGVCDGVTTGAPLTVIFKNGNVRSSDYAMFREQLRPGHADFTSSVKYNYFNDIRGGGHFSGRLTLALVAAGSVARRIIDPVSCSARLVRVGSVTDSELFASEVEAAMKDGDSVGGVVECVCSGVPVGLGEPFFDSVESYISHLAFSIPGVRGVEFGDGFAASAMRGSIHNDPYTGTDGRTSKNGAGGVNGGISNGNDIVFRVAFKPTSSIGRMQYSADFISGEMVGMRVGGRHDACFALRTPVIVESVAAIALADFTLLRKTQTY